MMLEIQEPTVLSLADPLLFNLPTVRQAAIPSANVHGTAKGFAQLFSAIATGQSNGRRVLSDQALRALATFQGEETTPFGNRRWGAGLRVLDFKKLNSSDDSTVPAMLHSGLGGSIAICVPSVRLSVSCFSLLNLLHCF
jgi:hypothetical protein